MKEIITEETGSGIVDLQAGSTSGLEPCSRSTQPSNPFCCRDCRLPRKVVGPCRIWKLHLCYHLSDEVELPVLYKHLFNLKFAAKELNRNAKKCDKEEKAEKAKIEKAIQKGNTEVARIHAENAICQKNQAFNFLRMGTRVDAVAARVQTAVTMGKVTKPMAGVVKSMDAALRSMNLEKISALMDKFEQQFETLDVQMQQMEDTMSSTTTLTIPQNQVDMLPQEMADEAGLDLNMELPQGQTGSFGTSVTSTEQDDLPQRLAHLCDQV
ncbi:charged multivesicular body protein 1B2-like [Hippopotamus amphibius kiboko]|uniref:charged multivesicular body protein 1B2-like n=1 Tax=Hippopotamus amphibius kiboko TaxID=575201 RepID=UPI00259165C4|nr:charged multivesicular body protein 1B2-like [Hippopotamus amphibius kiboko]